MNSLKNYFFLALIAIFSCSKDNSSASSSAENFSKLGIENITIENNTIGLQSNSILLELSNNKNITLTGTSHSDTKVKIEYSYTQQTDGAPTISVKSKYEDTRIAIIKSVIAGRNVYDIFISRANCSEEINYTITFANIG